MDKLGFKERIMAAGAIIVLIVVAWYFLFYSSQLDAITAKQNEINELNIRIQNSKIAPGTIDTLKNKIERLENEARDSGTKLVTLDEMIYVKQVISDKIADHNLEYTKIEPDRTALLSSVQDSMNIGIRKVPFTIFMTGEFFAIGKFLEELPDYPFLIRAADINLDTDNDIYPDLQVRLILHVFFKEG
ncbi:type 4a pilus biogenesis protein PilO [candidate division KSB1 bacterium]